MDSNAEHREKRGRSFDMSISARAQPTPQTAHRDRWTSSPLSGAGKPLRVVERERSNRREGSRRPATGRPRPGPAWSRTAKLPGPRTGPPPSSEGVKADRRSRGPIEPTMSQAIAGRVRLVRKGASERLRERECPELDGRPRCAAEMARYPRGEELLAAITGGRGAGRGQFRLTDVTVDRDRPVPRSRSSASSRKTEGDVRSRDPDEAAGPRRVGERAEETERKLLHRQPTGPPYSWQRGHRSRRASAENSNARR
jgi:hypothetical protein